MSRCRIELLGPIRALDGSDQECVLPRGKQAALLAYLAAEPDGADRDYLAALFWPDTSPTAARQSLRQALSSLRKRLGCDPFRTGDRIALDPGTTETDLKEFLLCLAGGDPDACLALVRGAPFTDVETSFSHGFESWLEARRTTITQRIGELVEEAGKAAAEAGRTPRIHELVALGARAGLDESALRAAIWGANGALPAWGTAAVGPDALESLTYRVRAEVPPTLALVLEEEPGWTGEILRRSLGSLPPDHRPHLIDLAREMTDATGVVPSFLRALTSSPGGAAVHPRTLDVLERLQAAPGQQAVDGQDIEWALEDALDSVLHEGPVVLSLPADLLDLRSVTTLARALGLQGGEGLLLVISSVDEHSLSHLPVQALGHACTTSRRIREVGPEPPAGVADPAGPADVARSGEGRTTSRFWGVAAVATVVAAALFVPRNGTGDDSPLDPAALLPDHDVIICSERTGTRQYFRWSPAEDALERFTADEAPRGCTGWLGSAQGDSLILAVLDGDRRVLRAYANVFSRLDQTGRETMPAADSPADSEGGGGGTWGWYQLHRFGRVMLHLGSRTTLELVGPDTAVTGIFHEADDSTRIVFRTEEGGSSQFYRLNLATGERELISDDPQDSKVVTHGDRALISRGAQGDAEDGSLELYLKDLRTGEEVALTENSWNDYEQDWSPDGRHICWQSEERGHFEAEIMVMELETGRTWNLSRSPGLDYACRFSPDGRAVVYQSYRTGTQNVFIQPLDGGPARNISTFPSFDAFAGFARAGGG